MLSVGTLPSAYADHLLQIVTHARQVIAPEPVLPLARRREFEGRILAILEPNLSRKQTSRLHAAGMTFGIALLALPLMALSPAGTSGDGPAEVAVRKAVRATSQKVFGAESRLLDRIEEVLELSWARGGSARNVAADNGSTGSGRIESGSRENAGVEKVLPPAPAVETRSPSMLETSEATPASPELPSTASLSFGSASQSLDADGKVDLNANGGPSRDAASTEVASGGDVHLDRHAVEKAAITDVALQELGKDLELHLDIIPEVIQHTIQNQIERIVQNSINFGLTLATRLAVLEAVADAADEDPRAIAALIRLLETDSVPEVRIAAAVALGEMEAAEAVPALSNALRRDVDSRVRVAAARALGEIEDPSAVEPLIEALSDQSPDARRAAINVLNELDSELAMPGYVVALSDPNVEVRRRAAIALGDLDLQQAPPELVAALSDEDPVVRVAAARSLGEIEDPNTADALAAALNDSSPEVRQAALYALVELESPLALDALIQALDSPDPSVRLRAAEALRRFR